MSVDVRADLDDLADELVAERPAAALIVCCAQASQVRMCRSVPQMPVRSTLISTSPGPTAGSGTSASHSPGSALLLDQRFSTRASPPIRT